MTFSSKSLPQDITVVIVGLLICSFLWFAPSSYNNAIAYWIGICSQTLFTVSSLVIFNRLRNKGGAAAIFLLGLYFLPDFIPESQIFLHLHKVYLGPFFWLFIIVSALGILEMNTKSSLKNDDRSDRTDDDHIIRLKLRD